MMEMYHGDEPYEEALSREIAEAIYQSECDEDGLTYQEKMMIIHAISLSLCAGGFFLLRKARTPAPEIKIKKLPMKWDFATPEDRMNQRKIC